MVLQTIDPSVRDLHDVLTLSDSVVYTKALGIEWNTKEDHFRLTMNELTSSTIIPKHMMVSNIAKIFDVLGSNCHKNENTPSTFLYLYK